jgi:hypothetical protein
MQEEEPKLMETDIDAILNKYKQKLQAELGEKDSIQADLETPMQQGRRVVSREYAQFRDDLMPRKYSWYEWACNLAEKVPIAPDKKNVKAIQDSIDTCHLQVTPTGVASLAILGPLAFIFAGIVLSVMLSVAHAVIFTEDGMAGYEPPLFFIASFLIGGLALMFPLQKMPEMLANSWRMEASNQMVLCVFYIVTYMRHTSNLEHAIEFASSHLTGPLSLDLRKLLWDVETEKYSTLKESIDAYLESWRVYNMEFVEAMHLIESSLYESSESRRLDLLDKSLDVILEETYEKMLHYAHDLKSPITMLHMLGIILPILGLVILPLVVNFMGGVQWYYLAMLYNVALPAGVYYMGKTILAQRPTGYGETDISEDHPELKKFKKFSVKIGGSEFLLSPFIIGLAVGLILLLIAILPLVLRQLDFPDPCVQGYCLLEYKTDTDEKSPTYEQEVGPFGIGATIFSFFFPLSIGLGLGLYYKLKSENVIKIRSSRLLFSSWVIGLEMAIPLRSRSAKWQR